MNLSQKIFIAKDKFKESLLLTHAVLALFIVAGYALAIIRKRRMAFKLLSQAHRSGRFLFFKNITEPWIVKNISIHSTPVESYMKLNDFKKSFGSRMMVLKKKQSEQEKGVLYIMYSELLHVIPKYMDMKKLTNDYKLVFEPSWSGYCTGSFLYYATQSYDSYFLAAQKDDYRFLQNFDNMKASSLGPCDWVDPKIAEPYLGQEKKYDIVMNSNWGAWKRHRVLFEAMRSSPHDLKVALIGFDWGGRTSSDVMLLADYYGVKEQITIFEKIPFSEVMDITCQSRISILLSLKEGSNRAIAESIFCDVPVVVLSNHVGGIVKNVVDQTGRLCRESELSETFSVMLNSLNTFSPRAWALKNMSCHVSTKTLNAWLKEVMRDNECWTQDIAARSNSPESQYTNPEDESFFAEENMSLVDYLTRSGD